MLIERRKYLITEILTYASSQQHKFRQQYDEDEKILKSVKDSMFEWKTRKSKNRYIL